MKKSGVVFSLVAFSLFSLPAISLAAQGGNPPASVQSLPPQSSPDNGHGGDGSPPGNPPWRVDQGGTGATSFTNGSVLFYSNGFAQDNANFFWNTGAHALLIGTNATTSPLSRLTVRGASGLGLLNLVSSLGVSQLFVDANGNVGMGTTNPRHKLDVSGAIYSRLVTVVSGSIDWNTGNVQSLTLTSPTTITFTNGQAGGEYKLILNQDAMGGRTVSWPTNIKWADGGHAPALSFGANHTDIASFVYDGTNYFGSMTSNFSATPTNTTATVAVLVVAGGGSGGAYTGGGGGGGGVLYEASHPVTVHAYSVTVGSGGLGSVVAENNGSNSTFDNLTALAGGAGGSNGVIGVGHDGGSGGGGGTSVGTPSMDSGTGKQGQGHDGGNSWGGGNGATGGGGGAGTAGASASANTGANGGNGFTSSISGSSVTYGGGGGGASAIGSDGMGGAGGGGNAGTSPDAGVANTGGGGGGHRGNSSVAGGDGGVGVVIISYTTGSITATGGSITTVGGNTIHTFTTSGTFTITSIN